MDPLIALIVLALLAKGASSAEPDPTPPPDTNQGGGGGGVDLIDTGRKLVTTGLGLLGTVGTGAAVAGGTGAGGASVTGGAGAIGAGSKTATTVAGGVGGGVATTTTTAVAGSLEGAIGAGAITLIVAIIIVCNEIAKSQVESKSFTQRVLNLAPNARDMCRFEASIVEAATRGLGVQKWEEADFRLDRFDDANKIVMRGYRTVMRWAPPPAGSQYKITANFTRVVRAMAYAYLRERNRRGRAINNNWLRVNMPAWRDPDQDLLFKEAMNKSTIFRGALDPAIGGLAAVPLVNGYTVTPRVDKSDPYAPTDQLVARVQDRNVDEAELSESDRQYARLMGLMDAIKLFEWDPTVYVVLDGREYRNEMIARLGLTSAEVEPAIRYEPGDTNPQRHGFYLRAEEYGVRIWIDPIRVKSGLWYSGVRPAWVVLDQNGNVVEPRA